MSNASAERQRLAVEAAELGVWEHDVTRAEVYWDARCRKLFGFAADAPLTTSARLACIHPEDRTRAEEAERQSLSAGTPYRIELRTSGDDGAVRWVALRGAPSYDDAGHPVRLRGTATDVTVRHERLEDSAGMARERSAAIAIQELVFEQAPIGLGFWDGRLRSVRANAALREMNEFPVELRLGRAPSNAPPSNAPPSNATPSNAPPSNAPSVLASLERVLVTSEASSHDITGSAPEGGGGPRQWRVRYFPVRSHERVEGVGVLCDEVTERNEVDRRLAAAHERERAARSEAERLNRMKDEFLSTVSHELRAPLQSILGWARTLVLGGLDQAQTAHGVETIERNAHAQVRIIEDILDVSRIISGNLRVARQPVDLVRTADLALDTIRPAALARAIRLTSSFALDVGAIVADRDRIKQVLWNLLSNAVKFTQRGGAVHLTIKLVDETIEVRVVDNGQGIQASFLPHVFERFRQEDGGTARAHGGLGLGLAIVRHLVEMHGGTVEAKSEGEGLGSEFVVRLPAQRPSEADSVYPETTREPRTADRRAPASALDGLRVLIADDEEDPRELLALVLRRNGAIATTVGSVREALQALDQPPFDVLVSDIGMPGEDGYALARALRDRPNRPRIVLALTAYARAEDRRAALEAGFDGHVAKPVDPSALVATIARLVAEK